MIGRFETVLWDVDDTLLDFGAAEDLCIVSCMREFGYDIKEDELNLYKEINQRYWEALERKEITREELYPNRFKDWFDKIGVKDVDAKVLNANYQKALGETPVLKKDTLKVLKALKPYVKQYVVSNGSGVAQLNKLRKSGIDELVDGIFISEMVGASKPSIEYFKEVAKKIENFNTATSIIIGDSLTSDIKGGNNAHIEAIWYNDKHKPLNQEVAIAAEVDNLMAVVDVLKVL